MQDQQYDGVVLEDKWGKSYLCSSCLLAYADLGEDSLGDVKDTEFGRYFLHDLEPSWDQRNIWARLYQHARPWATDLSKLNKFQLRDALLQMFARDEMRIWQLTDGWGKAPEGNGIGDGQDDRPPSRGVCAGDPPPGRRRRARAVARERLGRRSVGCTAGAGRGKRQRRVVRDRRAPERGRDQAALGDRGHAGADRRHRQGPRRGRRRA